jgi:heparinase II/III-like protein/uncharacterized protein DUF4962
MLRFVPALLALAMCLPAEVDQPLKTLRKSHPRLILLDADVARLRDSMQSDASAVRSIYQNVKSQAERILAAPPVEYKLIGPRLLDKSRTCLTRVYTLALLYRLDGDQRYLERALKELRAAAAFPDWHPAHFLDTAEMTHAFAIGYDWLYAALSAADKELLRRAIIEKGLDAAIPIYKERRWWTVAHHNWNQVCNGGITIGALAVAEDDPERATFVLRNSVESIKLAMQSYAPDGGWAEGPGYWQYATSYNVAYLAALETALGTDFGLASMEGFSQAGDFRIYFQGPGGGTFNYADAHPGIGNAPEMFWLARKFSQPAFAWDEQRNIQARNASPLDLVWRQPQAESPRAAQWPLDRVFRGVDVAFLRGDWEDPNTTWVAVKGGDNKANHAHLDLGSFVLDALGVRWAVDLGSDDYNLPDYFGRKRWTYYRLATESHNTVLIDGENQNPKAAAKIIEQQFSAKSAHVGIDLMQAYPGKIRRFVRGVTLADRKRVVVTDEIEAAQPVEALWGMVTDATVSVKGKHAELHKAGKTLWADVSSPEGAVFEVVSTQPPAPQNQNTGTRKLAVRLPGKVTNTRIEVSLAPQ